MAKIFDFAKAYPDSQAIAVPDTTWFRKNQRFLLWMANWSQEGQKLLKMEQTTLERIDEIWPNRVSQYNLDGSITTDFRVGCKWTNLINFQWEWVQEMAKQFQAIEAGRLMKNEWNVPVFGFAPALGATGTYYPQTGGGGSNVSCDGELFYNTAGGDTFANCRSATSNVYGRNNLSNTQFVIFSTAASSPNFDIFQRSAFTIDTSEVGSSSTINSGTFSVYGTAKYNATGNLAPSLQLYGFSPVSANDLSGTDYGNCGTTAFSSSISYASFSTTGYNAFSLNASGLANIVKNGITCMSLREPTYDVGGTNATYWAPASGDAYLQGYFADQTGTSNDPKIVIDYTPASFIPRTTIIA